METRYGPEVIKLFYAFMLNSTEHEITNAYKTKMLKNLKPFLVRDERGGSVHGRLIDSRWRGCGF